MGFAGARTDAQNAQKAADAAQSAVSSAYERAVAEALGHLSQAVAQIALSLHQKD